MNNIKINFLLLFILSGCLFWEKSLQQKYPYGLLSDDHSILTENDLLSDIRNGDPRPYNIKESQSGYYRWQCFPSIDVVLSYDKWRENDPLGPSDIMVTLCFFNIEVKVGEIFHVYSDRRARLAVFCESLKEKLDDIIRGEEYICINGEPDSFDGNKKSWTWNKMKTKKGCISLFEGDCNTYLEN